MPSGTVLAAVLAAVVAGYFGLVGLIVTKDAKVSDLRQAWIDALRTDVAQAVAAFEAWASSNVRRDDGVSRWEALSLFRASETSIRLRLPIDKAVSRPAFAVLNEMSSMIARGDRDSAAMHEQATKLVTSIQPVLDQAWERVKAGESWFRGVKVVSILLVASGALLAAYTAYISTRATASPVPAVQSGAVAPNMSREQAGARAPPDEPDPRPAGSVPSPPR